MAHTRTMESRTGREKQRYSTKGERLVVGAVAISPDNKKVLLIQSARRGGWVLPKGGWETDEPDARDAVRREAWEEAGIDCVATKDLCTVPDMRDKAVIAAKGHKVLYQFFQVEVKREEAKWPESNKRKRQWFSFEAAAEELKTRPELLKALWESSIDKPKK